MIREAKDDPVAQEAYLNLLRGWFKNNNFTPKAVAAAYMTGILPIKKDGSQSAISDFREFSVIKPRKFGPYVGFTEEEVRTLCRQHDIDFHMMKQWYDGYDVLTLLVHLGHLSYDAEKNTVGIPNEEIRLEFQRSIHLL